MASKQLGKFRQWAGEVIASRDAKTAVTDEFRELEEDIERRKDCLQRLSLASELYHHSLSKKKLCQAVDDSEKLLPLDALGIVMISMAEGDSAYDASLLRLGRAHCKIATLQEAYALRFQDFLVSLEHFQEDISEYELQRKKLESRRLSYDAAITKYEKARNGKKEKDRVEAEEEMETARFRYEETSEDVRAHMRAIQDNEADQLRELTAFLDMETNFVEQYLGVLKDVKSDWCDESAMQKSNRGEAPTHIFARSPKEPKFNSVKSKKSALSVRSSSKSAPVDEDSSDEGAARPSPSRRPSTHRRSDSNASKTSKPPSRPSSRASRKRSDSTVDDKDRAEKEKAEKSKRLSVAGWASSAVGSVTGRGKKNKDRFAALRDDEGERDDEDEDGDVTRPPTPQSFTARISKNKSKESLPNLSPKIPPRPNKAPSPQERKLVRALYDFSGSADELSFRTGDQIVVLNEVLDGWWMGELDGRKGLFPTPYTEVIPAQQVKPPLPSRYQGKSQGSLTSSEDEPRRLTLDNTNGYEESDLDEDHSHPLVISASPFYGPSDTVSIASSVGDQEDDEQNLMPSRRSIEEPPSGVRKALNHALLTRRSTTDIAASTSPKKAPPPPPPRRSTNNLITNTPPIPERKHNTSTRSQSSGSISKLGGHEYDTSPFDSATEISSPSCRDFKQNPFKPRGMCSNCFQFHT